MAVSKNSKALSTKDLIIDAAENLFAQFGYLGVSMSDIAEKLNITKAALYYHFTGKAEIYTKVLDEVFDNLTLSITEALNEKTTDKKLRKLIKNYLDFGFKEKNLIKALMFKLSPGDPQIKKYIIRLRGQITDLIYPLIKETIASKKLAHKMNSELAISLLTGMMNGLLLEYSFLNKKVDSEEVSNQIIAILFSKVEV